MHYTFASYDDYENIDDPKFHTLRTAYQRAAKRCWQQAHVATRPWTARSDQRPQLWCRKPHLTRMLLKLEQAFVPATNVFRAMGQRRRRRWHLHDMR